MDFKQLEAFAAVVDYGSFSEAARRLYLTQPTISSHIRTLEKELGAKLIIRTTKKITVTAKGYQFYESAVRILHIRNHLLESFAESPKRMIDLGVSTIPSSYLLPELLAAFGKNIRIFISIRFSLTAPGQSKKSWTAVWISALSDRIPVKNPAALFHSARTGLSLQPRFQSVIFIWQTGR